MALAISWESGVYAGAVVCSQSQKNDEEGFFPKGMLQRRMRDQREMMVSINSSPRHPENGNVHNFDGEPNTVTPFHHCVESEKGILRRIAGVSIRLSSMTA